MTTTPRASTAAQLPVAGDGPASEFYDDGKAMMAYAPAENLLAVASAPSTIDATLEAAYNLAGIYFPFTDLIVADPYSRRRRILRRPLTTATIRLPQ